MTYSILLIDDNPSGASLTGELMESHQGVEVVWCRSYEEAFAPLFFGKWDVILINSDQTTIDPVLTLHRVRNLSDDSTPTLFYGDPQRNIEEGVPGLTRPQRLENILSDIKGRIASLQ